MKSLRADLGYRPDAIGVDIRLILFHGGDAAASADLAAGLATHFAGEVIVLAPSRLKDDPGALPDEAAAVSMFGDRRTLRIDGAGDESLEAVRLLLAASAAGKDRARPLAEKESHKWLVAGQQTRQRLPLAARSAVLMSGATESPKAYYDQ